MGASASVATAASRAGEQQSRRDGPTGGHPLLLQLRALAPRRPLDPTEARRITENQAAALLAAMGVTEPAVPESIVTDLPFVKVRRWKGLPTSAMLVKLQRGWEAVLRAEESHFRQRFSLLHEFKHILDSPYTEIIYSPEPSGDTYTRMERAADYFAACALMPADWMRRDWEDGVRDIQMLAARYKVSPRGIRIRLAELGLAEPEPNDATVIAKLTRWAAEKDGIAT